MIIFDEREWIKRSCSVSWSHDDWVEKETFWNYNLPQNSLINLEERMKYTKLLYFFLISVLTISLEYAFHDAINHKQTFKLKPQKYVCFCLWSRVVLFNIIKSRFVLTFFFSPFTYKKQREMKVMILQLAPLILHIKQQERENLLRY